MRSLRPSERVGWTKCTEREAKAIAALAHPNILAI